MENNRKMENEVFSGGEFYFSNFPTSRPFVLALAPISNTNSLEGGSSSRIARDKLLSRLHFHPSFDRRLRKIFFFRLATRWRLMSPATTARTSPIPANPASVTS